MLRVEADKDLRGATTFGVAARCESYAQADSVEALREAFDLVRLKGIPWRVLGEGSNILLTRDQPGMIIRVAIHGIHFEAADHDAVLVRAGAGVNWHTLVRTCLERGVYGLENLALIPGSVGAAPVQNIGAYGVELSDIFESVEVLDTATGELRNLYAGDCRFAYRDSAFKQELAGRCVITQLVVRLSARPDPVLRYPALTGYLAEHGLSATRSIYLMPSVRSAATSCLIRSGSAMPEVSSATRFWAGNSTMRCRTVSGRVTVSRRSFQWRAAMRSRCRPHG